MTFVTKNITSKPRKLKKIDNEEWKNVPKSNGIYMVSNYGRLKSYKTNKTNGQIMKGTDLRGFTIVELSLNGTSKKHLLHKLVASVWIKKPSRNSSVVIHKDWNKKNNHVDNLAWMNKKESTKRMFAYFKERTKARGKIIIRRAKLSENDVLQLKEYKKMGFSQATIAKIFNISSTQVNRITSGENWGHIKVE
jgi:hypothetical protein